MRFRCLTIGVLVAAFLVAFAGAAHAVAYEISVKNRTFCCDSLIWKQIPLDNFKIAAYHTVVATASQTGGAPQPLKIGMGHAANFYSRYTHPPSPFDTVNTVYGTASFQNGKGTLAKNGGNAVAFSFCPKQIGLPAPGACTHPAKATPVNQGFNGRIKVTPGKNKFGGTLQILAGPGGIGGTHFYVYPGGPYYPPNIRWGGYKLAPIGAMTPGYAVTGPNPSYMYPNYKLWQQGAGPFTTGMVTLQVTMQGGEFPVRSVKLAGYDNRTPGGLGNIQLVSGLLANSINGAGYGFPIGWKMRIRVIPEPEAALQMTAGILALVWLGRRRSQESGPACS